VEHSRLIAPVIHWAPLRIGDNVTSIDSYF